MKGSIFLVQPSNTLVELRESGYVTEAVLQQYLADHPALLAGEQMSPESPRQWLLISQEMGVPHAEDGSDRWSLDHLFLDQDAVPTLVETKRSSDTRIRREIVGQMLDYAANGVVYWPVEKLRTAFQRTCEKRGVTTDIAMAEFLGDGATAEDFWQKVGTNLKAGRIRMVFVADEIPTELRKIVEFLNEQMDPAEVVAVEIKQFVGEGMTTLVPRVLGVTAAAQAKKQGVSGTKWTEERFAEAMTADGHGDCVEVFRELVKWTAENRLSSYWGQGAMGSFGPYLGNNGRKLSCCYLYTNGRVDIAFTYIKAVPGFLTEVKRVELVRRFNEIPHVQIDPARIGGSPGFSLSLLIPAKSRALFFDTLAWYFTEVRNAIANANAEGNR